MTIDERIERLEHVTAAHIEQAKKDYEENRRLWREHQTEIAAIWQRMEQRDRHADQRTGQLQEEMAELRRERAERDRIIDKRIADLVSAIGELCRRMDAKV